MLFQVEMEVRLPHDMAPSAADELKRVERERAQQLMRDGKWRHLWRVVGHYSNTSIFEVESHDELHAILTSLPLFPFMTMKVTPLCRHPSSIRQDDRRLHSRQKTQRVIARGENPCRKNRSNSLIGRPRAAA